jgi:hypothetical protein
VRKIILQHGHRTSSVSSQTSHQLQRFNPNSYFCELGTMLVFNW